MDNFTFLPSIEIEPINKGNENEIEKMRNLNILKRPKFGLMTKEMNYDFNYEELRKYFRII